MPAVARRKPILSRWTNPLDALKAMASEPQLRRVIERHYTDEPGAFRALVERAERLASEATQRAKVDRPDWSARALDNAQDMVRHFHEQIVEQLIEDGKASDDYNNDYDGGDSYHHETHVDRDYGWKEAADLLSDLGEYEETDSGLWDGIEEWERILATKAAFTYGNAVADKWNTLIGMINDEYDATVDDDAELGELASAETPDDAKIELAKKRIAKAAIATALE